ncbi:MAG: hypothetical protein Q7S22_00400 [Candidatus Micrarchaeota archaeon]|nr:hypothetical protein [Candidatus Micrarchaeota archaeon]
MTFKFLVYGKTKLRDTLANFRANNERRRREKFFNAVLQDRTYLSPSDLIITPKLLDNLIAMAKESEPDSLIRRKLSDYAHNLAFSLINTYGVNVPVEDNFFNSCYVAIRKIMDSGLDVNAAMDTIAFRLEHSNSTYRVGQRFSGISLLVHYYLKKGDDTAINALIEKSNLDFDMWCAIKFFAANFPLPRSTIELLMNKVNLKRSFTPKYPNALNPEWVSHFWQCATNPVNQTVIIELFCKYIIDEERLGRRNSILQFLSFSADLEEDFMKDFIVFGIITEIVKNIVDSNWFETESSANSALYMRILPELAEIMDKISNSGYAKEAA